MAPMTRGERIRVGTSGYTFDDWKGIVYPKGVKGSVLPHYARLFDCVEINTTFYRVPPPSLFAGMLRHVNDDFVFLVKAPKEMTHERALAEGVVTPFLKCIEPLLDAEQLGCLLVQFPFSFKTGAESLVHVERIAWALAPSGTPISIEFRHSSWLNDSVYRSLEERGLGFVNVDLPELKNLPGRTNVVTSDVAYYRLHGRNTRAWWAMSDNPHDRYDYLYQSDQLEEWVTKAKLVTGGARTAYLMTNNCRLGQSVVSALQLAQRLDLPMPSSPPGAEPEMFEVTREELIEETLAKIATARGRELA